MPSRTEEQALLKVSCDHRQNQAEKPIAPPLPRRRGASSSAQGYGVTSRRDMGFHQLMTEDSLPLQLFDRSGSVRLLSVRLPRLRSPLPFAEGERIKVRGAVKSVNRVEIIPHPSPLPCKGRGAPHGPTDNRSTLRPFNA
jgi:hypothetical protein